MKEREKSELIRKQPSLGEKIVNKATEGATRGIIGWLANRKNKKLEGRVQELEEMLDRMHDHLATVLNEFDERLKRLEGKE